MKITKGKKFFNSLKIVEKLNKNYWSAACRCGKSCKVTKKMLKEIVYGKELCSTYDDILSEMRENAHSMNIKLRIPHLRIQNPSKCIPRGSIISWNGEVHPP